MYCPQCGQVQPGDTRYCSRCGLSLYEVGLWLSGAGELVNPQATGKQISPRRKNMIRAAKVTFFSGILCPIGLVLGALDKEPAWFVFPFVVLVGSLIWMLYGRLFLEGDVPAIPNRQPSFKAEETNYLPPRRTPELEAHRANTAEMIQPDSVTEYTTNLLRKRE